MKKVIQMILILLLCVTGSGVVMAQERGNSVETARTSSLVIVLDPGHDSSHGGAGGNGLREEVLNLKIAQYCMEELSTYNNVTVYMTRSSMNCPYPGGSAGNDNSKRVEFAQSVGANLYVSLHLNSLDNTAINGTEVFYPNKNYRADISTIGAGVSQSIMNELVSLGLNNRGVMIRNAQTSKYADGSVGDYYQVIREAKQRNITGIIVEHAYISSPHDASNFLSTEEKLKALGVADATGIAKYYGLQKGGYEKVFDATYYANQYPELKELYGNDEAKLLNHFINTGMSEGHRGSENFDVFSYRGRYTDLQQKYGTSLKEYYHHYMYTGQAEGRDGSFIENSYTVTFENDGKIINTQTVLYGHGAVAPNVDKEGMNTIYNKQFFCITEDTQIQVTYEAIKVPESVPGAAPKPQQKPETNTEPETESEIESETESESEIPTETEPEVETETSTDVTEMAPSENTETTGDAVVDINAKIPMYIILMILGCGGCIALVIYLIIKMKTPVE